MKLTRREALAGATMAGVGAGLDHLLSGTRTGAEGPPGSSTGQRPVDFHGPHQAGISTPAQDYLHFSTFDLTNSSVEDLRSLLTTWTAAAGDLTGGAPYLSGSDESDDTGEAIGLTAAQLTITFGFGPSLFEQPGRDRFGLAPARPAALKPLPPFTGESVELAISGSDTVAPSETG